MNEYTLQNYRKRPVVIQARRMPETFTTKTMEGELTGKPGDWLITGIQGEQYPCDDSIFRATYDVAEGGPVPSDELCRKFPILRAFRTAHLPVHLRRISVLFGEVAYKLAVELPCNAETSAMLRKLVEAKDCAVRARAFEDQIAEEDNP